MGDSCGGEATPTQAKRQNFSALSANPNGLAGRAGGASGPLNGRLQAPGQGGAKKLVIKNLKSAPTLPDQFEARALDKLRRAVLAIQTAKRIDSSLEELYGSVENLCGSGAAEKVYTSLKDQVLKK